MEGDDSKDEAIQAVTSFVVCPPFVKTVVIDLEGESHAKSYRKERVDNQEKDHHRDEK